MRDSARSRGERERKTCASQAREREDCKRRDRSERDNVSERHERTAHGMTSVGGESPPRSAKGLAKAKFAFSSTCVF